MLNLYHAMLIPLAQASGPSNEIALPLTLAAVFVLLSVGLGTTRLVMRRRRSSAARSDDPVLPLPLTAEVDDSSPPAPDSSMPS